VLAIGVALAGCAPAGNPLEDTAAAFRCCTAWGESSAGFWLGLWHGIITPVTFVISLFSSAVGIYEVHNNGGWYDTGFSARPLDVPRRLVAWTALLPGSRRGRGKSALPS
jgi:hypothetical protein